jgi:hypothetical protein
MKPAVTGGNPDAAYMSAQPCQDRKAGPATSRYSVMTLSDHSTRETKIVGLPYFAP